jgi:hypothetical protein
MHINLGMVGRYFTPQQYFDQCATISGQILTGYCQDDSRRNLGSNCLLGFVLTALVLLHNKYISTSAWWADISHQNSISTSVQPFLAGF